MRSVSVIAAGLLLIGAAGSASAQAAGAGAPPASGATPPPADTSKAKPAAELSIEGAWNGYLDMGGNGQQMNANIKKEGGSYTGTISGMQGDVALQQIELKGDMLTMMAAMPGPSGNIEVWYSFKVAKDTLSGQLDANFNGQAFSLPLALNRAK